MVVEKRIIDNYYLAATDELEGTALCYHDSSEGNFYDVIIGSTVIAVGYNNEYLIAKQHPRKFPYPPDKSITNYYILPLKKGIDWKNNNDLIGPLSESQFYLKRKELNIPDEVTFTFHIEL